MSAISAAMWTDHGTVEGYAIRTCDDAVQANIRDGIKWEEWEFCDGQMGCHWGAWDDEYHQSASLPMAVMRAMLSVYEGLAAREPAPAEGQAP